MANFRTTVNLMASRERNTITKSTSVTHVVTVIVLFLFTSVMFVARMLNDDAGIHMMLSERRIPPKRPKPSRKTKKKERNEKQRRSQLGSPQFQVGISTGTGNAK
jgi:hypothetical protein